VATWIKIVLELVIAFFMAAGGSTFWSLHKSPKFLIAILRTASNLDLLQTTGLDRSKEVDEATEMRLGYPVLLLADVSSSIKSWQLTRNLSLLFCILLLAVTFIFGVWYCLITALVFLLTSFMDIQTAAQGNVFNDVRQMIGRVTRWNKSDPESCRKYCLETNPKFFREMFLSVERRKL